LVEFKQNSFGLWGSHPSQITPKPFSAQAAGGEVKGDSVKAWRSPSEANVVNSPGMKTQQNKLLGGGGGQGFFKWINFHLF
jgi:hypothetical protein